MDFVMTDFQGHYDLEDQWFSEPFYTLEEGYLSVFAYGTALDEAFTTFSYSFSGQAWEGEVRKGREGRKGRSSWRIVKLSTILTCVGVCVHVTEVGASLCLNARRI